MIWLKKDVPILGYVNEMLCGYIPQLDKRYSEKEIGKLNEHNPYQGWSNLAQLVMKIQGYSYVDGEAIRFPTKVTSVAATSGSAVAKITPLANKLMLYPPAHTCHHEQSVTVVALSLSLIKN